jgi:hypothetical protein
MPPAATALPDAEPDTDTTSPWAYRVLLAATVFVGTVSFSLSFHGLYDLLKRVGGLPSGLALLGPLGVDGLTLCAIAATFLLRRAPTRVRLYAWTVFAVPTCLSIAGQIVDAHVRRLTTAGVVVAAVSPALFALASHLTVVARRWSVILAPVLTRVAAVEEPAEPVPDVEPDSDEPRTKRAMTPAQAQAVARRRRSNGATYDQIATGLADKGYQVSAKTVERWLKPAQPDEPEQAPPNGRVPEPTTN